jgi:hypothetical protein
LDDIVEMPHIFVVFRTKGNIALYDVRNFSKYKYGEATVVSLLMCLPTSFIMRPR